MPRLPKMSLNRLVRACALMLLCSPAGYADCLTPSTQDDWRTGDAADLGFDPSALKQAVTYFEGSGYNYHALLLERQGILLVECYRDGQDASINRWYGLSLPFKATTRFDTDELHDVRSISKSVVSLLYGIALAEKRAPSLHRAVLAEYPQLNPDWATGGPPVTYAHLLGMNSGLDWQELGRGALTSDETPLYWRRDLAGYVLDRAMTARPGARFDYNGGATALLGATLERHGNKPLAQMATDSLFTPMGITRFEWVTDARQRALSFSGLRLRPRDLLKFGRLVNQHGRWQDRQLVPSEWIEQSTRARMDTRLLLFSLDGQPVQYGYHWWTGKVMVNQQLQRWIGGIGNGGQRLLALPDLDISIVLTAGAYGSAGIHRDENELLLQILNAFERSPVENQSNKGHRAPL